MFSSQRFVDASKLLNFNRCFVTALPARIVREAVADFRQSGAAGVTSAASV